MTTSGILLIVFVAIGIIAFALFQIVQSQKTQPYDYYVAPKPTPKEPEKQQRAQLTEVEKEAIRQADEAFDLDTHNAIVNGTYTGLLPYYDGYFWSRIYKDLYHTKIAGINYCRGIKDLAGVYFDALLIPEPNNKFDKNAIKIVHAEDQRKLGYIPAEETNDVRIWVNNQFPYKCRAHIDEYEDYDEEMDRERTYLTGVINIKKAI